MEEAVTSKGQETDSRGTEVTHNGGEVRGYERWRWSREHEDESKKK